MVLHIDCHVAGLYQKIPYAGLFAFYYKFSVFIVICGACVSCVVEHLIDLVAKPALGECDIKHLSYLLF